VILINYVPTKEVLEMKRSRRKYTKEFKQEAVHLALKSPNIADTAERLGMTSSTLHTWISELKRKGELGTVDAAGSKDMASLVEENRRLHKELLVAREEKEILKKAAAYFAQHQK
jgi:transposase